MRSAGIYLIQAEVGSARSCIFPAGELAITFRVGRSSATHTLHNAGSIRGELPLNCLIQLNVDSTALEAQRCSLTFTGSGKHMLGIALISLPKEKNLLQSTYRITQNEDKRAEVDVRIKISPLDGSIPSFSKAASQQSSSLNLDSFKQTESKGNPENLLPKIYVNNLLKTESLASNQQSNINVRSKISEEFSQVSSDERKPKSFKVREEDRVVQTTESELKRFKEEKEVYYQLYQIQKGKSQVAAKFISNFIKKITDKCPSLASFIAEQSQTSRPIDPSNGEKKPFKNAQQQQQVDSAMIVQLEQANRTLHRQVEEYKRLVEQMKIDIIKPNKDHATETKNTANLILPGLLELSNSKSTLREKSKIKPTGSIKEPVRPQKAVQNQLKEVDFNKWLNLSIGQREAIQVLLQSLAQKPVANEAVESKEACLKKLKGKLDKSFTVLLARKEVTKDALLNHKKQINKFFEEVLNF